MIYELRVYRVVQGRMAALLTRFVKLVDRPGLTLWVKEIMRSEARSSAVSISIDLCFSKCQSPGSVDQLPHQSPVHQLPVGG